MTQICVCGLINHPNNPDLYLAVSRKNNPNDFGLPGGKFEKDDIRYDWGLEREIIEETGLKTILNTNELFTDIENNNIVLTYKGIIHYKEHPDEIKTEETGEVKWLLASQLITGSFADYNKKMFDFFGIKYD